MVKKQMKKRWNFKNVKHRCHIAWPRPEGRLRAEGPLGFGVLGTSWFGFLKFFEENKSFLFEKNSYWKFFEKKDQS